MFVHPTPSPETLKAVYSSQYFKNEGKNNFGYTDYDKDKEPMRGVFELYLEKLEHLTSGRKIFDVGAATGYFLDIAAKCGWKTYGSEISAYGAETAQMRGHKMILGSIVGNTPEEKMDVVTLWDVLEHVDDPKAYLYSVYDMLSENGVVAINTVDASSWWAKTLGPRWHLIVPPEHLNYFSKKSIGIALKDAGFSVIEIRKIGKKFSPAYIFKMLASWQGLLLWKKLAQMTDNSFFRFFSIPINLHDNMFIIARKDHAKSHKNT